jgi:hypothetical protein
MIDTVRAELYRAKIPASGIAAGFLLNLLKEILLPKSKQEFALVSNFRHAQKRWHCMKCKGANHRSQRSLFPLFMQSHRLHKQRKFFIRFR